MAFISLFIVLALFGGLPERSSSRWGRAAGRLGTALQPLYDLQAVDYMKACPRSAECGADVSRGAGDWARGPQG
jgi:hypothetical protein